MAQLPFPGLPHMVAAGRDVLESGSRNTPAGDRGTDCLAEGSSRPTGEPQQAVLEQPGEVGLLQGVPPDQSLGPG